MRIFINKYLMSVVLGIALILFGIVKLNNITGTKYITDSLYFSLLPFIICSIFDLKIVKINNQGKLNKKGRIYVTLLTVLFVLMISFRQIIKSQIFSLNSLNIIFSESTSVFILTFLWVIYLPACIFATAKILSIIFCYESKSSKNSNLDSLSIKKIIKYTWPMTIISLVYMLSTYPGVFDHDFPFTWRDSINHNYNDWMPISFTHLVTVLRVLFKTPYSLVVIQTLLWIYIFNYATYFLAKHIKSKKAIIFYIVNTIIFLICFAQIQVLWKEILFSLSFFGLTITLLDYILSTQKNKYLYIQMAIFGTIIALFRHGAIIVVAVTFLILICRELKHKDYKAFGKMLIVFLTPILSFVIIVHFISFHKLNSMRRPAYVAYTVPIYMIGYVVYSEVKLESTDINTLEKLMPVETWKTKFIKYNGDSVSRHWLIGDYARNFDSKFTLSDILQLNCRFLVRNPIIVISSYLDITSILWEIGTPHDGFERFVDQLENLEGGYVAKNTFIGVFTKRLNKLVFEDTPILKSMQLRGGFSLLILILSFSLLWYKKRKTDLLAFIPTIMYLILLFLSIPYPLTRYVLQFITLSAFLLPYAIFSKRID